MKPGSEDLSINISDRSFKNLIARAENAAITVLDINGKIMSWSKGSNSDDDYLLEGVIGEDFGITCLEEKNAVDLRHRLLTQALNVGNSNHTCWCTRKDGSSFWCGTNIIALRDNGGDVSGFVKITQDLSKRKIAEDSFDNYIEEFKQKNEALRRSEELYQKTVSEIQDYAIILLDKDGIILNWNKGAQKLKGYSAGEVIGKSFHMFYPEDLKVAGTPNFLLNEATKNGSAIHEGWRVRKDGSSFWGYVTITALHNDMGEIIGFSKITRDLTERKIAEDNIKNYAAELKRKNEILEQSEERYHRMVDEVQDYAIILLDKEGNIENWNSGAAFIKGYSAKEILGKNFRIFYAKQDLDDKLPEKLLQQAVQFGKANHEGWRVRKDGSKFWGSVVITALHDTQNNVIGFSKVTRDLTERKKNEDNLRSNAEQLDLKNKSLQRLNDELSSFAHIASHDLKEPLRKIMTFSNMLEETETLSEKGKGYLERITSSIDRMRNLIDDLLSYAELSHISDNFESVDLNKILQAVEGDLEVSIQEKKAKIQSVKLPVIVGITFQFHQLFLNLISNALKFAKPTVPPLITIDVSSMHGHNITGAFIDTEKEYYEITIRDNGLGFENEYAVKIFEIFQRMHSKTFSGTGVGLSIVKKIVENHQGSIVAEGEPGVGATFRLYIPIPSYL